MNNSEKQDLIKIISDVYNFYRQDFSEFAGAIWINAMAAFDLAAVSDAISRHVMNPDTGQFCPKPADIVKMLAGRSVDSAQVAWSKINSAIRSIGTYASVCFDDPIIHRVIDDMGGWIILGSKSEDEWPFVAKEFITRYQGYILRSERPEYPRRLVGMVEMQNAPAGFRYDHPRLIGDQEKAQKVLNGGYDGNRLIGSSPAALLAMPGVKQ